MEKGKLLDWLARVEITGRKNSPLILTGFAVVGVISTAYSAYKAGPIADKILDDYRKDMRDCHPKDKEAKRTVKMETAKKLVPVMTPTVLMGGTTIAAIIGSHSISSRRIAVLSAAYSLSEASVKSLNGKIDELLGEKKARAIKDSIVKDRFDEQKERDDAPPMNQFVLPGDGTVLCKDIKFNKYFYSSAEKIRQAILKLSDDIRSDMFISLNDLYMEINSAQLEPFDMGNELGWNIDDCYKGKLPIELSAILTDEGRPCLCIDYDIFPKSDYRNLH